MSTASTEREPDGPGSTVEVNKLQKDTMLVGVGSPKEAETQHGGQLLDWKGPRVLNLEKESSKHIEWTHWEQV